MDDKIPLPCQSKQVAKGTPASRSMIDRCSFLPSDAGMRLTPSFLRLSTRKLCYADWLLPLCRHNSPLSPGTWQLVTLQWALEPSGASH